MDLEVLIRSALNALQLRLADLDLSNHGRVLQVFIEKESEVSDPGGGVTLLDCEAASKHLQRVFEVEGVDYDRLEVSSPGLDRKLKTVGDFARFVGLPVDVHLRSLVNGRRHIVGIIQSAHDEKIGIGTTEGPFVFELSNLKRARLVPQL
jgi:ribosome maturation factor RimP